MSQNAQVSEQSPWIVLTLRRTGGTSLASFLSDVSAFESLEHEPFNSDRSLGAITRDFRNTDDSAALTAAMNDALTHPVNIKHCIETVPQPVTRALIQACHERGYRFILLTRRDEAKRIGSLLLAKATGAWGVKQAQNIYPDVIAGKITAEPIMPQKIRQRVAQDQAALGRTLSLLRHRNVDYTWYLFEDLYFGIVPIFQQAIEIATSLGTTLAPEDPRLQRFAKGNGQNSLQIAAHVPGYDKTMDMLRRLCAE